MKALFRLLVVVLLVGGWVLSAAALHVIYTGKITLLPKDRLSFSDTYVDARAWTLDDIASHPNVVKRIIDTGKTDLLTHVKDPNDTSDLETQLRGAMERTPTAPVEKKELVPATNPVTAAVSARIDW